MSYQNDAVTANWIPITQTSGTTVAANASFVLKPLRQLGFKGVSITYTYTGTAVGTLTVQGSDFGNENVLPTSAQLLTYPSSSQTPANGVGGWIIDPFDSKFITVNWVDGSSGTNTGLFTFYITQKASSR